MEKTYDKETKNNIKINKNNHYGKCKICGRKGKLTFEHIPPKSTMNKESIKALTGKELDKTILDENRLPWDYNGLKYENLQKGMGDYTLCESCNNITGELYGNEYQKVVLSIKKNYQNIIKENSCNINIKNVYPNRFIKQVLSMFCSVNDSLVENYPYIKDLILDQCSTLKDFKDFKIYIYILKTERIGFVGDAVILKDGKEKRISEIFAYPCGFILDLSKSNTLNEMEITKYLKYSYNTKININLNCNVHEKNNFLPCDYRTKYEIMNEKSKEKYYIIDFHKE